MLFIIPKNLAESWYDTSSLSPFSILALVVSIFNLVSVVVNNNNNNQNNNNVNGNQANSNSGQNSDTNANNQMMTINQVSKDIYF